MPVSSKSQKKFYFLLNLTLCILACIALTVVLGYIDFLEIFFEFSREHEDWELDDIFVGFIASMIILMIFMSYHLMKNLRELRTETEKRILLEQQLARFRQSQSTNVFAAGLAHSANNFLQPIATLARLSREELPEDSAQHAYQGKILEACEQATNLFQDVTSMSRKLEKSQASDANLNEIIKSAVTFSKITYQNAFEIKTSLPEHEIHLPVSPITLLDVLLSLISNARQASQNSDDWTIEVTLTDEGNEQAENLARLTVKDFGCGIEPEQVGQIFDPFYSTKTKEGGTGLGLSFVKKTVMELGGQVAVESEPGQGATFTLTIPYKNRIEKQVPTNASSTSD